MKATRFGIVLSIFGICFFIYLSFTSFRELGLKTTSVVFIFISIILLVFSLFKYYKANLSNWIKRELRLRRMIENLTNSIIESDFSLCGKNQIDINELELSRAEYELLEALCIYKESNLDLGLRLNKSPNTIKVQLASIMTKTGTETRHQLTDLCRSYFVSF
ncbi:MAG: hypothetical protein JXR64_05710 [Spirochaetales bacterium]|nr:hypothetical protein [Spirochaetales bacterium]